MTANLFRKQEVWTVRFTMSWGQVEVLEFNTLKEALVCAYAVMEPSMIEEV